MSFLLIIIKFQALLIKATKNQRYDIKYIAISIISINRNYMIRGKKNKLSNAI